MRAAVDTGVFISALISDKSYPCRVLELWLNRAFELVTSEWQLEEIRAVSRYKRVAPLVESYEVGGLVNRMKKRAVVLSSLPRVDYSPDPDDNPVIAAALVGRASYLVSGDKGDLLALGRVQGVQIVTARAFAELVG